MSEQKEPSGNPWMKSLFIWVGVLLALFVFVAMFDSASRTSAATSIGYSDFLSRVAEGTVRDVEISGDQVSGTLTNDTPFRTYSPGDPQLVDRLAAKGVKFRAKPEEQTSIWVYILY